MSNTRKSRFEKFDWTPELLREWAFETHRTHYLPQDFGLVIVATATIEEARFFLEMAADTNCPKHDFFLDCLYMLVGQIVREGLNKSRKTSQQDIEHFLLRGAKFPVASVQQWVSDSRQLLKEPQSFDYDDWFCGRLARHALELDGLKTKTKCRSRKSRP